MVYNPDYPLIVGGQQRIVLNIVKLGVAVLAFDPPGQGERTQYWDAKQNRSAIGGCGWDMETCTASGVAHQDEEYAGRQLLLTNVSAASVWLWDARRALDYLLSRREVDGARVGVVGCSGGGTQAAFLSATDRRLGPAAIGCYMSTLSQDLRLIGPTGKTEVSPHHTHTRFGVRPVGVSLNSTDRNQAVRTPTGARPSTSASTSLTCWRSELQIRR